MGECPSIRHRIILYKNMESWRVDFEKKHLIKTVNNVRLKRCALLSVSTTISAFTLHDIDKITMFATTGMCD